MSTPTRPGRGTRAWSPSRLAEWDPDRAALKSALRAAAAMPAVFALADHFVGGQATPIFAAFGGFALMVFTQFTGPLRMRVVAHVALVLACLPLIALGTLVSQSTALATAAMLLVGFAILFSGVIGPYFAASSITGILAFVLPTMIPADPSAIPDRMLGWLMAGAAAILALYVVFPARPQGPLRTAAAEACRSLARLVRDPDDPDSLRASADAVARLRRRFVGTPYRPTGPTGPTAALASLVDELGWMRSLFRRPVPGGWNVGRTEARQRLARSVEMTLTASAEILAFGDADPGRDELGEARRGMVGEFVTEVRLGAGGQAVRPGEVGRLEAEVERTFRLRKLSYSAGLIADYAQVATGREPSGEERLPSRELRPSRGEVAATRRILGEHLRPGSVWLRNSLRGAVGLALAVMVAQLLVLDHSFWVVLGTLSVLRSNALGTGATAVRAVLGTTIGICAGALVLIAIGSDRTLLWVVLPVAVLFSSYAPRAISFAAGQAGFSVVVMVLFNLISPEGWEVGLVRFEDVAIGAAVSVLVGALLWPRGAETAVRRATAAAYRSADAYVTAAAGWIERPGRRDGEAVEERFAEAVLDKDLLDAAVRQQLEERGSGTRVLEDVSYLAAGAARVRRTGDALFDLGRIAGGEVADGPLTEAVAARGREVSAWYSEFAQAIEQGSEPPAPRDVPDLRGLMLESIERFAPEGGPRMRALLCVAWAGQHLEYLRFLEDRLLADDPLYSG